MNKLTKTSGIYQIINLQNGKCYIGQSINLSNRCAKHKKDLSQNVHTNKYLQNAWNKYGELNFEFRKVIDLIGDKTLLTQAEQYWNDYFKERSGVYNLRIIAESNSGIKRKSGMEGKKHSPETRAKMTASQLGNHNGLGNKRSEETRQRMSLAQKGKIVSLATREKISNNAITKPVESIDPITGLVTEYRSAAEASRFGYHHSHISEACRGVLKTHKKLYWRFI